MELSGQGLDLIRRSEGFRGITYLDPSGISTIGYGHRLLPGERYPTGIEEAQAEQLLASDVCVAERAVSRLVQVALTQGQFDALTDFCFNLGAGRLAASTLLKELNQGHYDAAREQLLCWDKAGAAVSAGLRARREAEYQLFGETAGEAAV